MNKRALLTFWLIAAIVVFGLVTWASLYRFALPQPEYINAGPVENYPPGDKPYFFRHDKPFFIVNTGEKFLILVAQPPHPKGCQAKWMAEDSKFLDPCLGIQFQLDGTYILGPSPRSMDQFEFKVENGDLLVNLDQIILGERHP
jgi:Rieske Fe-S protein